jgi:hypothetical protein
VARNARTLAADTKLDQQPLPTMRRQNRRDILNAFARSFARLLGWMKRWGTSRLRSSQYTRPFTERSAAMP